MSGGRLSLLGNLVASYLVRLYLLLEDLVRILEAWVEASTGW